MLKNILILLVVCVIGLFLLYGFGILCAVILGLGKGMYESSKNHKIKWKEDWRKTFIKGWNKDPRKF